MSVKIIRHLNFIFAGGISGLYFFTNAYHLDDVKNNLEFKIPDACVVVGSKIKNLVKEVMNDMKLSSEEQSLIKLFVSNDYDLKHIGYPDKKFGAWLGVPQHFVIDKMMDFVVVPMVENKDLGPESPEALSLKNLLLLSREAKKFAVANEIYETKHISFYLFGVLPAAVFFQANLFSIWGAKLLKALKKEFPSYHRIVFLLALWVYIIIYDMLSIYTQDQALQQAAQLGPSYVEGGIEYYEKVLARNKELKRLSQDAPYTETGELKKILGIRTFSMPFQKKLEYLKKLKTDSNETNKEELKTNSKVTKKEEDLTKSKKDPVKNPL